MTFREAAGPGLGQQSAARLRRRRSNRPVGPTRDHRRAGLLAFGFWLVFTVVFGLELGLTGGSSGILPSIPWTVLVRVGIAAVAALLTTVATHIVLGLFSAGPFSPSTALAEASTTAADRLLIDSPFLDELVRASAEVLPPNSSIELFSGSFTVLARVEGQLDSIDLPPLLFERTPDIEEVARQVASRLLEFVVGLVVRTDPNWLSLDGEAPAVGVSVISGALEVILRSPRTGVGLVALRPVALPTPSS